MKILIIGGNRFLGVHLTRAATDRNHEVTHFNRGNSPATDFGIELIRGDRRFDLDKLSGGKWDTVVDTCGFLPDVVKASAKALSHSVGQYVFISSQSAYADVSQPGVNEDATLTSLSPEQLQQANSIEPYGENYGKLYNGLKALCERAAQEELPGRTLIIRPGLIVGPYDNTDRFTYWVARIAKGGEVLAPGRPDKNIQFIDVRDLAEWLVKLIEQKETGVFNASGPPGKITMQDFLLACKRASESDATFTWADEEFLLKQPVMAWSEMPLWLPEQAAPHLNGFMFLSIERALAAGLRFRSLDQTVSDTLRWYEENRSNSELKAGIDRLRETDLLRGFAQKSA